ncbi:SUMO family protein SMT3 [Rhizophagus irregularis DAOM 197198w]|uniref:SUMO family protein SMT3 n=3 Tax=Rhizophagus irregularis TaxID=588596 RepID=A0A015JG82_RHIIW|nr:SUMO family protein SMT3 [Rhizophagus irregularis DAOM 197198w]
MDQLSPQFIKTEAVDPIDSFISFHVKNVLRTTPFKKLKEVYCKRNRLKIHATKFLFDGLNVMDNDTPDSLEMEEGDSIHVIFAPAIR